MQKSSINNQNQPSQQQNSFENPVISAEDSHNEENVAEKTIIQVAILTIRMTEL